MGNFTKLQGNRRTCCGIWETQQNGLYTWCVRLTLGIAINPENNSIYICDGGNNRVQVYNKFFEFVFQFSDKMKLPVGICIKQNKIYVTQFDSHCLIVYSTEGKYLNSVGMKGKKELEFD